MRWTVSGFLLVLGAVLLYLFAAGIYGDPAARAPDVGGWAAGLRGLWEFGTEGALALFAGTTAVVFGVAVLAWSSKEKSVKPQPWPWNAVLQTGLTVNVVVVAALLFLLSWMRQDDASLGTLGHLYLLVVLTTALGALLAAALALIPKKRALYAATLVVHFAEVGAAASIFCVGFGG